ncbi:MAG: hypothetical protein K1Y02_08860 [Candidatus Hydrogenedentes bacterium]|nr:hypothetical protein [Candidatus Hydrogenedentota bacterium]
MILEDIEQKVLSYLKQVSRALVPFDQLVSYLRRQSDLGPFDERDLLDFLRKHELFQVIDSPFGALDAETVKTMEEGGFSVGPSVILVTRIPPAHELAQQFDAQIAVLLNALGNALQEARASGDEARVREAESIIARAERLREKFQKF